MSATDMKGATDRRPPKVYPDYPDQRYFMSATGTRVSPKGHPSLDVRVYRHAGDDCAELAIRAHPFGELTACLDARELRELALALLDAAYDIDVNPAGAKP